jgi:hypothetical protein
VSKSESVAPAGLPTHTPAIRIRGVATGSPQYNDIIDQYRGQLQQFHLSQQTQVRLSGQRYYKVTKSFPGATMTYQNNSGQETITLAVETTSGGEEEKVETAEYWKWAIVEVTIPNIMGLTTSVASAWMTPPPKHKEGYAINKTHPIDTDKPPLSYPIDELGKFISDVQDNTYHASLRVDLRPFPGGVKFDLYGYIRRYQDGTKPGDNTTATKRAGKKANNITSGSYSGTWTSVNGLISGPWPTAGDISGRTIGNIDWSNLTTLANIQADFPETVGATFNSSVSQSTINFLYGAAGAFGAQGPGYGGTSFTWTPGSGAMPDPATLNVGGLISAAGGLFAETTTFGADGIVKKVRGLGAMDSNSSGALNGAGPTDADGNWGISFFDYTLYFVGDHPTVPNYIFPERDCPVKFVVLDDGPDAMTNRYGAPLIDNIYRWETSKKYPNRWPMRQIATIHMKAVDDSGFAFPTKANHYSMIKLGTIIIHPRKGKGGIKFIAA